MSNRAERRRAEREQRRRKFSAHATDDEIFGKGSQHRPIPSKTRDMMTATLDALQQVYGPNYDITMFIAERRPTEGRTEPLFNYMSTADRADMYACLRAWLKKNEAIAGVLHKFEETSAPEGSKPS